MICDKIEKKLEYSFSFLSMNRPNQSYGRTAYRCKQANISCSKPQLKPQFFC